MKRLQMWIEDQFEPRDEPPFDPVEIVLGILASMLLAFSFYSLA